jgi:hypothetical protein
MKEYYPQKFRFRDSQKDQYYLRSTKRGTKDLSDLLDKVESYMPEVRRGTAELVLDSLDKVIQEELLEGYEVKLPFLSMELKTSGVVDDPSKGFDPKVHKAKIKSKIDPTFMKTLHDKFVVNKSKGSYIQPEIQDFVNIKMKSNEPVAYENQMIAFKGKNLKFDESNPEEGVVLIHSESKLETKMDEIGINLPSKIVCKVPANLAHGDYKVEIRIQVNNQIRTGSFNKNLTIQ